MANLLDELTGPVNDNGREARVIERQLPVQVGTESKIFEIALWVAIPVFVLLYVLVTGSSLTTALWGCILGILPGVIFIFMKISALNYFQQLEQRIQADSSEIHNYIQQRVTILENVAGLLDKAIDVDKDVMKSVAALRSGIVNEVNRSDIHSQVNTAFNSLLPHLEAYPELKSHNAIADAMQQNDYLQREITAARTVLNSRITQWNTDIFSWPTKMIVAAKQGYTTRIPFSVSVETIERAKSKFF